VSWQLLRLPSWENWVGAAVHPSSSHWAKNVDQHRSAAAAAAAVDDDDDEAGWPSTGPALDAAHVDRYHIHLALASAGPGACLSSNRLQPPTEQNKYDRDASLGDRLWLVKNSRREASRAGDSTPQNSRYFQCSVRKTKKLIKSKPTWKLKQANSILESFECFCQISSELIRVISSYTVSKLMRFWYTKTGWSRHSPCLASCIV